MCFQTLKNLDGAFPGKYLLRSLDLSVAYLCEDFLFARG